MQFYSGNILDGSITGKGGHVYEHARDSASRRSTSPTRRITGCFRPRFCGRAPDSSRARSSRSASASRRDVGISRREALKQLGISAAAAYLPQVGSIPNKPPTRPVPTASQLAWQRDELAMFLHFGVNTFTDREWGDGQEDPAIFAPAKLDARQWARTAQGRRLPRDDPHGEASRRLLPLAEQDDDAHGGGEPVARRPRRRRAGVRRRVPRGGLQAGPLSVAVGSQQARVRRFAALQRSLLRAAHRAAHAIRRDPRSLVRRRERRGPERQEAGRTTGRACGRWCDGCSRRR